MGNICPGGNQLPQKKPRAVVVLILGVGEAGKTTLVRQLALLDNHNEKKTFDDSARKIGKPAVLSNIVRGAYELLEFRRKNQMPVVEESKSAAKSVATFYRQNYDPEFSNVSRSRGDPTQIPEDVAESLIVLARDEDFMGTPHSNAEVQIYDGWSYFMNKIATTEGWGRQGWFPDDEDLLHVRHRTNGVVPNHFYFEGQHFEVLDAGGQKIERNKWLQYFDVVDGLIWVQSLSDYDQLMFEEKGKLRFEDALEHWQKTIENPKLQGRKIVFLLNKFDKLLEKFCEQKIPIDPAFGTEDLPVPVYDTKLTQHENAIKVADWYANRFRAVPGAEAAIADVQIMTALKKETVDVVVRAVFIDNFLRILSDAALIGAPQ